MVDQKKFLDQEGVKHLWSKVNMQDYPNNETLMAVINAIDETKADKNYVDNKSTYLPFPIYQVTGSETTYMYTINILDLQDQVRYAFSPSNLPESYKNIYVRFCIVCEDGTIYNLNNYLGSPWSVFGAYIRRSQNSKNKNISLYLNHDNILYNFNMTDYSTADGITLVTYKPMQYLPVDDGAMSMEYTPLYDSSPATKKYVDDKAIQSDWDETDETSLAFIKNKPDEDDALELLVEMKIIEPVAADDGSVYIDENGAMYSL